MSIVTQQFAKIENQIEQERKKEKRKEVMHITKSNKRLSYEFFFKYIRLNLK